MFTLQLLKSYLVKCRRPFRIVYSRVINTRGGSNKRGGWKIFQELINREDKVVFNKQGG